MAGSKIVVYGAVAANVAIAVTKFSVAAWSGSSAMLSEGIHSAVDTGNGLLLLLGLDRARKPPDPEHPFGHGKELYFWSLMVAVLIFGVGGGVSAYEGILHMLHPHPLEDASWSYAVLGAAALFEGTSFTIALRELERQGGELSVWEAIRRSKDPSTYTVIAEDGAALLGLAAAFVGVFASHALDAPIIDGLASVIIGVLLASVAGFLIYEVKGLLVGEGVSRETAEGLRELVRQQPGVAGVGQPLTMYLGPEDVLLVLDVCFEPQLSAGQVMERITELERRIRERWSRFRRISIEASSLACGGVRNEQRRAGTHEAPGLHEKR